MKRSPGLRTLSSEHHTGLVLARRAATAATDHEVAMAWSEVEQRFKAELEPHFQQEETMLLPSLREAGEKALVERTLAEHARMRSLIYDEQKNAESLRLFAELLKAHIRFEERQLFETAQARLPEFELAVP